jgi:hypothetical protein
MKNLLLCAGIVSFSIFKAQSINLEEFATGFTAPVEITHANDNRMFVVQQNGIIKIVQPNGTLNSADFLNISSKITYGGERTPGAGFSPTICY